MTPFIAFHRRPTGDATGSARPAVADRSLAIVLLAALLPWATLAEQTIDDPGTWYREGYAPLWTGQPQQRIAAMLEHYAPEVETHRADGAVTRTDRDAWLRPSMAAWAAEGWVDSELDGLVVDRINPTTAAFKARWVDRYESAADEVSCGWYLADWRDGRWRFTAYADLDCADHDF